MWRSNILLDSHPRICSFSKNEDVSVYDLLTAFTLGEIFNLPLSIQARGELQDLQTSLADVELIDAKDIWRCVWGSEGF